jgi:hypothetical protein
MREYKKKKVVEEKKTLDLVTCDVCKKVIHDKELFFRVSTSHSDWGNDSFESLEHEDICSEKCLREKVEEYIKDKSDTKHIDIEMERLSMPDNILEGE